MTYLRGVQTQPQPSRAVIQEGFLSCQAENTFTDGSQVKALAALEVHIILQAASFPFPLNKTC